jgi:prepilin-type processing-associated H-X9-DG protein
MATTNPQYDNRPDPPKPGPPVLDYARPDLNVKTNMPVIVAVCCIFALAVILVGGLLFGETRSVFIIELAIVLALLCSPPLAIILGVRGIRNAHWNGGKGRSGAIVELCLGLFGLVVLLASIFLPYFDGMGPGDRPNRVKCASNLKGIGTCVMLYLNDHPGPLPPDFGPLIIETDMTSQMVVCPSSGDEPAEGADPKAVVQTMLNEKGHLSFIYLGKGMTAKQLTPQIALAYEPLTNHAGEGINVLYGDGHAQWFDKKQAAHVIAELQAGQNPPRP